MDVALVGVVVPGVENHSLAVLGHALRDAGFEHRVIPFAGFGGMADMLRDVLGAPPRIVGISLQTSEAALAALAFASLLRARGYAGTIVVGGHFASLAPDDVLACRAVDVVVQLAGEHALVGLARGVDALALPGTITRSGHGAPPQPVEPRALPRDRLNEHLGFGAADLIISRGCYAHCGYCCVSTVSDLAEQTGAARQVTREVAAIADEIAECGARAIHFMDDNILPLDPDHALAWLGSLRAELAKRRVPPIAFSLQLRADVVTPQVADALVELGLVRAYVGIDGYTPGQLAAIGRRAPASAGPRALELLSSRGVFCVANALLVGPTIRFDTISREVDGLAAIAHAPVHLLPIEARPGTVYHRRASVRGLIEGGPLWPAYRFEDERSFLIGEVIARLPTRLVERSVPIALYDLAWALGVARRLAPEVRIDPSIYAAVTAAWNADQLRVLRAAVAAAPHGRDAIDALIAREQAYVRAHDEALIRACDDAIREIERAVSAIHRRAVRAHARGRLLGGLAFAMGLSSACHSDRVTPDATVDVAPIDAPAVCADPNRMIGDLPGGYIIDQDCTCGMGPYLVEVMFNERGEITAINAGNEMLERCLLDLVASYCYPSYAGQTASFTTCHLWIA